MVGEARNSVGPKGRVVLAGWLILLALAFGWILRPSLSPAQIMEGEKRRTLTVIGRSERLIAPEVAWLTLTVESRDQVASQAVADNARRTQEVMDRLRSQLGKEDKLYTLGYELFPYYNVPAGPWPMRGGWPPPGVMLREKMAGGEWRGRGERRAIHREGTPEGEEKPPELKGYVILNRIQLETCPGPGKSRPRGVREDIPQASPEAGRRVLALLGRAGRPAGGFHGPVDLPLPDALLIQWARGWRQWAIGL